MKKISAKIKDIKGYYQKKWNGKTAKVLSIDRQCFIDGYPCDVEIEGEEGVWNLFSDNLIPMDISDVPDTHNKNNVLINAWVFSTAAHDAWNHCPPKNLAEYEKEYGCPWKDVRVYDVGKRAY